LLKQTYIVLFVDDVCQVKMVLVKKSDFGFFPQKKGRGRGRMRQLFSDLKKF